MIRKEAIQILPIRMEIREATKKMLFFSGQFTKRGGGKGLSTKEKKYFS